MNASIFKRWHKIIVLALLLVCASCMTYANQNIITPEKDRRGEEQTFLTFPEWFLVFSPAEYADYVHSHTPTQFPFWGHIHQFWQSYGAVTLKTMDGNYPFNGGYHLMIIVIGVSTTVEYAIRSAYENIIGRLSELTSTELSYEDKYAANIAQKYVDFIRVRPWYEFDFLAALKGLWMLPAESDNVIRKWERRYALTTEYLVKSVYGKLIGLATHTTYEPALSTTAVVLTSSNDTVLTVKYLPRYEAFKNAAMSEALSGKVFTEIAGNSNSALLLISIWVKSETPQFSHMPLLFTQSIITQPGWERRVCVVSVKQLSSFLRSLNDQNIKIEHIFDY